jgi:hypothetical protein
MTALLIAASTPEGEYAKDPSPHSRIHDMVQRVSW